MFSITAPTLPSNISSFVAVCASIGQQAQCCTLPVVSFLQLSEAVWCDWNEANHCDAVGPSSGLRESSCLSCYIHPVSWRTLASDRSVFAKFQLLARIRSKVAAQDEKIFEGKLYFPLLKKKVLHVEQYVVVVYWLKLGLFWNFVPNPILAEFCMYEWLMVYELQSP